MRTHIEIEIPDAVVLQLVRHKGKKIIKHDFGRWSTEYHNRPVWREDVQPAVMIDQQVYTVQQAFEKLYAYELQKGVLSTINRIMY